MGAGGRRAAAGTCTGQWVGSMRPCGDPASHLRCGTVICSQVALAGRAQPWWPGGRWTAGGQSPIELCCCRLSAFGRKVAVRPPACSCSREDGDPGRLPAGAKPWCFRQQQLYRAPPQVSSGSRNASPGKRPHFCPSFDEGRNWGHKLHKLEAPSASGSLNACKLLKTRRVLASLLLGLHPLRANDHDDEYYS